MLLHMQRGLTLRLLRTNGTSWGDLPSVFLMAEAEPQKRTSSESRNVGCAGGDSGKRRLWNSASLSMVREGAEVGGMHAMRQHVAPVGRRRDLKKGSGQQAGRTRGGVVQLALRGQCSTSACLRRRCTSRVWHATRQAGSRWGAGLGRRDPALRGGWATVGRMERPRWAGGC